MNLQRGKSYYGYQPIQVTETPKRYQDKYCWPVVLQHPTEGEINAYEITTEPRSAMKALLYQPLVFVCLSVGSGDKLPWIKIDEAPAASGEAPAAPPVAGEDKDKVFLVRDCMRMATDLVVSGKINTADADLPDLIATIAKKLALNTQKIVREL